MPLRFLLVPLGLAIVAGVLVDVLWTTFLIGSGSGPMTRVLTGRSWRLALRTSHSRSHPHRYLRRIGFLLVTTAALSWIALLLLGWYLVFCASGRAVVASATHQPASLVGRFYFTAFDVFTLGIGDLVPGGGGWQVATVGATGTGLLLITGAITYLVPVVGAVAAKRALATQILALGRTAPDVLANTWQDAGFPELTAQLRSMTPVIASLAEQHRAYPILHLLHSGEGGSIGTAVVVFDETVTLLTCAVPTGLRPPPAVVRPARAAVTDFVETVMQFAVDRSALAPPPPRVDGLRARGLPVAPASDVAEAVAPLAERRRRLAALLVNEGRDWSAVSPAAGSSRQDGEWRSADRRSEPAGA